MSRSNGPLGQPGGQNPPVRQPVQQQDPYAGQYQQRGTPPQPQQQWAQPPQYPPHAHDAGQNAGQTPFFFPQPPNGSDHGQGTAGPGYEAMQPSYAPVPQGDPRAAAPRAVDPRGADPRTGVAPQQYAQPQQSQPQLSSLQRGAAPQPGYTAQPLVPPYGQYAPDPYLAQPPAQRGDAAGHAAGQWPPADTARFDLNQYPPQTQPTGTYPGAAPAPRQQGHAPQDWQLAPRTGSPSQGYPAEPSFGAPQGYNADSRQSRGQPSLGIPPPNDGHDYHGVHAADGHDDGEYEDDIEQDPPRRGRKGLMLVVGLVGAIGVGAGCAYAYKTYFGSANGRPPLLKADAGPNKTKPAVPGGKEFANVDRKITARLGEDGAVPAAGTAADDSTSEVGGPRKVQIIPISPNGAVAQPPPARVNPPTVSVPGMAIEFGNAPGARAQAPPVVQTIAPPAGQAPNQGPARVAVAQVPAPPVAKAPVVAQVPNDAAAAPVKKAIVAKAPAAKASDAFSPGGSPAGVGASAVAPPANANGGAAGFVAVVASQPSAKDAMTAYADLKQKYPEVLGDKPADVREAVVNGKTWHRAVVGPPGSRASVENLCAQLKTAGFLGCWPSTY